MAADEGRAAPPRWALRAATPLTWALAGRRWFPLWAVVHHRGRRSGTPYATTIAIVPTLSKDIFLVGLPWGASTNWAQNVLAAGGATITWKGRQFPATGPRLVDAGFAVRHARPLLRRVVGSGRFPAFLVLDRPEPSEPGRSRGVPPP